MTIKQAGAWLLLGSLGLFGCSADDGRTIVIGSKNFTEQLVLAELVAQHIEARTDLRVKRKVNLGGTFICHHALTAGELDLYVEYTGTALLAILKGELLRDPGEVYRRVQADYREQFGVEWLEPFGFNDTFAIIVRREDAERLGLKTISDLKGPAPKWRIGFSYEFADRADGFRGLAEMYGLRFQGFPRNMEIALLYRAVAAGQVDVVAGNSTDGIIDALDLVILEDDLGYFPPYYAAPVVRQDTLEQHPELEAVLSELGGLINEEEMRRLNYAVDGEGKDLKETVRVFLQSKGLLASPVN